MEMPDTGERENKFLQRREKGDRIRQRHRKSK